MDIREDSNANAVTALFELPGLKKEDVNIDVHNNRLTVSGESKSSSEREGEGWVIRECSYGSFSRSLQLPTGVKVSWDCFNRTTTVTDSILMQPEEIKAKMENGVLAVTFPKTTAEQAPKKITVS
jgi:HSP20 family protein